MKKIMIVLLMLLFSTPAYCAILNTYYFDSVGGSDANDGTTTVSPWKSLAHLDGRTVQPGDSYYFKDDCEWDLDTNGYLMEINLTGGGTSTDGVIFTNYGNGVNRPIFRGTYKMTGGWSNYATNVWRMAVPAIITTVTRVHFETTDYYPAANVAAINATKRWYVTGGYLYVYSTQDPDLEYTGNGVLLYGPNYTMKWVNPSYVTISNLKFVGGYFGLQFSGTYTNLTFHDCTFINMSKYTLLIYGATITNFEIYNCYFDTELNPYQSDVNTAIQVYDNISAQATTQIDGFHVHNNQFYNFGHAGVGIDPATSDGTTSAAHNMGILIENNIFENVNNISPYARPVGFMGDNGIFRYNFVKDSNIMCQFDGSNVQIIGNIFDTINDSLIDPSATSSNVKNYAINFPALGSPYTVPCNNTIVQFNTFYKCLRGAMSLWAATNANIQYNYFVQADSGNYTYRQIRLRSNTPASHTISNNYLTTNINAKFVATDSPFVEYTVASLEAAFPTKASGNVSGTSEILINTTTYQPTGALVDTGPETSSYVTEDYYGLSRPQNANYDIGAIEKEASYIGATGVILRGQS